jgi:hypothetical protein
MNEFAENSLHIADQVFLYNEKRLNKILTVDFDETLAVTSSTAWGGTMLVPIERVVNFVKSKIDSGFHVYVVTFRNLEHKKEVVDFCIKYRINIKDVICTEGKTKTEFIKQLNSSLHIDDHVETCTLCTMAGIEVLMVDWGQDKHNTTAKFFNKI